MQTLIRENDMKVQCITASDYCSEERKNATLIEEQITKFAKDNQLDIPNYREGQIIFCKNEDEIIGFLQFYQYSKTKEFYISWVFVKDTFRGHGLFNKMFKYLKSLAILYDIYIITSHVLQDNHISNLVHKKLGFIQVNSKTVVLPYKDANRFNGYTYVLKESDK